MVWKEDFILPVYKGELEKGYQFDGWKLLGFEGKKALAMLLIYQKIPL